MTGAFIAFPGGGFASDPAGMFARDQSTGSFRWLSTTQPQLIGSVPTLFYDRSARRWLPSNRAAVYPDGTRYAYVTGGPGQTVHIVDVGTGQERILNAPHPSGAGVFDFSPAGVYLAAASDTGESGLWLLDAQNGSERLVTSEKIVAAVGDGKAWLSQLTSSQVGSTADTLVALDLATESKTVWVHRNAATVGLIGLTSDGLPVVSVGGEGVSLVHSPGVEERISSGSRGLDSPIDDAHGIWFASYDGMYLYSRGAGLRQVETGIESPAGKCS